MVDSECMELYERRIIAKNGVKSLKKHLGVKMRQSAEIGRRRFGWDQMLKMRTRSLNLGQMERGSWLRS